MSSSVGGRPDINEYFLEMIELVARRGTCTRRKVAAIVTDRKFHVLSTGYNGVPTGFTHCTSFNPCQGASDEPGNSSRCMAVHAEQNALIQCSDLPRAYFMFCSCTPCFTCAKMIANTGIKMVVCREAYADKSGVEILKEAGIFCIIIGHGKTTPDAGKPATEG